MIVVVLAQNTFREVVRDKVLLGTVAFGLALMLLTRLLSPLVLGEDLRLTVDLGLSSVTGFGMLIVVMVGASLVGKEIDRRTIYNLLSRPVARPLYLVGKWMGLCAALWVVALMLGAGLQAILLWIAGTSRLLPVLSGIYMAGLELMVMASLAVLFSALSTPVLSALYTVAFFCAGSWSYDLRLFAAKFPPVLASTIEVVAGILPNLPLFNVRTLAADGLSPPPFHFAFATLYALLYAGCVLSLAAIAFETREFK